MEETTFKLDRAISDWRNGLKQQGIASETIEELESHLIESTESLQAGGLSQREAFYTAVDRLGKPDELSAAEPDMTIAKQNSNSGCLRAFVIAALIGGLSILLGAVALTISYLTPPKHSALVVMQVAQADETASFNNFLQTQFEVIKGSKVLDKMIEKTNLTQNWAVNEEEARLRVKKNLKTTNRRGTDLIEISYLDPDPKLAALIANSIAESYRDQLNQTPNQTTVTIYELAGASNSRNPMPVIRTNQVNLLFLTGIALIVILIPTGIFIWRRKSS